MDVMEKTKMNQMFENLDNSLMKTDPEFVDIISNFSQSEVIKVGKLSDKNQ